MKRALYSLLVAGLLGLGCGYTGWQPTAEDTSTEPGDGDTGGPTGTLTLDLPFAAGTEHLCTQGVGGTYSHTLDSTWYSIDLDTGNSWDEPIFAPIKGVARVHYETAGFGYHLNIDLGDGTYVVLAHLSQILVADGDELVAGQFVAFEGCTGACTGDHLHLGLLQGDAELPADYGTSLPVNYWLADASGSGEPAVWADSELICDLYTGHEYTSDLATVRWHPDGTLVKYPGCADIFVIDKGELALFANESVFESYNFEYSDVVPMTEAEFSCFGEGNVYLDTEVQYQAVMDDDYVNWLAYETLDNPGRYRQAIDHHVYEAVVESWGIPGIYNLHSEEAAVILENYPIASGQAYLRDGALVSEEGDSTIYVVHESVALPIESWDVLLLMGFEHQRVHVLEEDTLALAVASVGSCSTGIGCVTRELVTSCGGEPDIELPDDEVVIGDDDDDSSGDDDDDSTGDDDDTTDPDPARHLELEASLTNAADYLWLSGELLDEYGAPADGGFSWSSLVYEVNTTELTWSASVETGWSFRFSIEYEQNSVTNWSCVAPFPPGTITLDVTATVDGVPITIQAIDNYLGGCELFLEIPP